ncbi:hypothetical protein C8J55DRAFT_513214 [Lentinula edodes]|uniref:Histone H1 n=1 Tax=Lentinula lateritia TaxID=40482 RepID=A0A9W9AFA7_9AGAR|nr:hypothetical protein C8J55DRAFT_513214 [Lentinula edodes]
MSASVSPTKSNPTSPAKSTGKPVSSAAAKPASKASGPKRAVTTKKVTANRKATTSNKPKVAATKSKAISNSAPKPSWKEIIKECILLHKDEARQGVSRTTIKKYAEETYKLEMNASHLSQLNRAITNGAESGMFVLPKGPSGKVKLPSKTSKTTDDSKEVRHCPL